MKIAHITPGSGGAFYCQNCFRDSELIGALISAGHEVYKVPLYLPIFVGSEAQLQTPVFYGAINLYLDEQLPLYRYVPAWLRKALDSQPMLRVAARLSGSTNASGLEEMTPSMLRGERGGQAGELEKLVAFLNSEIKPEIVHFSNALLLGMARRMKENLGAKIICSLQDENEWIDPMRERYREHVWDLMAEKAREVDMFVAASEFYAEKASTHMGIPPEKIRIVFGGIDFQRYETSSLPFDPPVLGYMSRMAQYFGLDIVIDAFLQLKMKPEFSNLRLHLTGGYNVADKRFVKRQLKRVSRAGYDRDVKLFKEFDLASRIQFLKQLTLLSVPVPSGESFGAYQVEALAAGVPVVQPNVGCYPEFVSTTGGGIIFEPNNGEKLAEELGKLLAAPERIRQMAATGRKVIGERYTMQRMAEQTATVYEEMLS